MNSFFGKKVLITGHTGFKGFWLALKRIFKVDKAYTEIEDETSSVLLTVNGKKYQVDEKTCMSTTDDDVKYFISDFDALGCDPYEYLEPDPIEFFIREIKYKPTS